MIDTTPQIVRANLDTMKKLNELFAEAFDEYETYRSAAPSNEYLSKLLDDPGFIALAAVVDDVVVGGLAAYVLKKFEQERSEIYIYDLAVAKGHRRQGTATKLINELRRIAREFGAWVIYVQADVGDEPAIKLYQSLGVREDVHHFDIMP